jgi:hypothetical protein
MMEKITLRKYVVKKSLILWQFNYNMSGFPGKASQ